MVPRSVFITVLFFTTGFVILSPAGAPASSADSGGDYVIIYRQEWQSAITPLAAWRSNHGHTVVTKTYESILDEYPHPGAPDQSVKDFITYAYNNWSIKPEYVFLVGGYGSVATHNISYNVRGLPYVAPWEDWFGCMDDDYLPEIAIGRLPVYVTGKVEQYVDRIIYYESHTGEGWKSNAYLAVNDQMAPNFDGGEPDDWQTVIREAGWSMESRFPSYYVTDIDLRTEFGGSPHSQDDYAAYLSLKSHFDAGLGIAIYYGSTDVPMWECFLNTPYTGAVKDLDNVQKYPVIICPTCFTGDYTYDEGCIGSDFLREQKWNGNPVGSIVYFAQVIADSTNHQTHMGNSVLDSFFHSLNNGPTIGKYIMAAKRRLAVKRPEYKQTVQSFCLLGDPATVLDLPGVKLPVLLSGWPHYLDKRTAGLAVADLTPVLSEGAPVNPPPLTYPTDDPKNVVCGSNNRVFGFDSNASRRFHAFCGTGIGTKTAIVDINADGKLDVITLCESGDVKAFDENGYLIPGTAFEIPSYSSFWMVGPAFGDINRDGYLEIVVATDDRVIVYDKTGQTLEGWPAYHPSGYKPIGPPAVGDLDKDGYLEIVVSTYQLDHSYLCVYGSNGIPKSGWPICLSHVRLTPPALADISDDGTVEIVVTASSYYGSAGYDGRYFVFNYAGTKLVDKLLTGYSFQYTPSVGNFVPWPEWPGKEAVLLADYALEHFVLTVAADGSSPFIRNTISMGNVSPSAAPTIGDVNSFPTNEVVVGCGDRLMAYDLNCGLVPFEGMWDGYLRDSVSSPIVTDLNADNLCDIVCSDSDGVYAFTTNMMYMPLVDFDWIRESHDNLNMGLWDIAAPTGVVAQDYDDDQGGKIVIAWTPSVDNGMRSSRVAKYKIWRKAGEINPPGGYGVLSARGTITKKFAEGERGARLNNAPFIPPNPTTSGAGNAAPLAVAGGATDDIFECIATVTSPTFYYVDEGLENLRTYEYYVVATDLSETYKSQRSVIVSAVPHDNIPPAPPTNFDLEIIHGQLPMVRLTWTRSIDDPLYQEGGYEPKPPDNRDLIARVSGFGGPGGIVSPNPRSVAGGAGSGSATVNVAAYDAGGSHVGISDPASGAPTALPYAAKEGEAAKMKAGGSRGAAGYYPTTGPRLWTDKDRGFDAGAGDVNNYVITKDALVIWYYPDAPSNEVEYLDEDVSYGNIYYYWIKANDGENDSEQVGPLIADLLVPPGDGGPLAFAPDSPFVSNPFGNPFDGGSSATAPFAEPGWGPSRTQPTKVITCKPNPVTGTATFTITLPTACAVKLDVYDLAGRKVDTVFDKAVRAGGESVLWQPTVPAGVYIYRLETPKRRYSGRVVVAR